jgi:hypothetical protein
MAFKTKREFSNEIVNHRTSPWGCCCSQRSTSSHGFIKTKRNRHHHANIRHLDDLLESTVDGGAHGVALVEVDGGKSALADTLGSELEFLVKMSKLVY